MSRHGGSASYWQRQYGSIWHISKGSSGWVIENWEASIWLALTHEVELKANSTYYYDLTYTSEIPAVALFWKTGDDEQYLAARNITPLAYPAAVMIATPDWDEESRLVTIVPLIFLDAGTATVQVIRLDRIDLLELEE